MNSIFHTSIDVGERLQVVRHLNRGKCEAALANVNNERLQATVIKALQARLRKFSKVATTIRFEDHGQDFLEWDLDAAGKVIESRPGQAWLWCKKTVTNHAKLRKGGKAQIDDGKFILYPLTDMQRFKAGAT